MIGRVGAVVENVRIAGERCEGCRVGRIGRNEFDIWMGRSGTGAGQHPDPVPGLGEEERGCRTGGAGTYHYVDLVFGHDEPFESGSAKQEHCSRINYS